MCEGKVRHLTGTEAKDVGGKMASRGELDLYYYRCCYCAYWHVGHLSIWGSPPKGMECYPVRPSHYKVCRSAQYDRDDEGYPIRQDSVSA